MQFIILSPSDTQTFDINWLSVSSNQGNFVIQPGHAPMIIAVPAQNVTLGLAGSESDINLSQDLQREDTQKEVAIPEGILEVEREKVVMLVSESIPATENK